MAQVSSPEPLLRLGLGYWEAKAFLTACELKLFTLVESGTDTSHHVAQALSIPVRSMRFLLNAMAALGLLEKQGTQYSNTSLAATFLVEGRPLYMGDFFVAINRMFYAPFVEFQRALKEGHPVWSTDQGGTEHVPISGEERELFVRGMHSLGAATAAAFGDSPILAGRKHLLDIAGGSGVMAIAAVQSHAGMKATVLDRPAVCELAQPHIAASGLAHRIDTLGKDIFVDPFPAGADTHLYSNVLQNFDSAKGKLLLKKSYDALPRGGLLIIADYVLDEEGTSPTFPALFNLFALVAMEGGEARSFSEYKAWLDEAGFEGVERAGLLSPTSLVWARKP